MGCRYSKYLYTYNLARPQEPPNLPLALLPHPLMPTHLRAGPHHTEAEQLEAAPGGVCAQVFLWLPLPLLWAEARAVEELLLWVEALLSLGELLHRHEPCLQPELLPSIS